MSEYSNFGADNTSEFICPACGAELTEQERTQGAGGWNCRCGDFIYESMAVNPYKGLSCKHKQNILWR